LYGASRPEEFLRMRNFLQTAVFAKEIRRMKLFARQAQEPLYRVH
jgi:hypothetical protein